MGRLSYIPPHLADMPVIPHVRTPPETLPEPSYTYYPASNLRSTTMSSWKHTNDSAVQALGANITIELNYCTDSGEIVGVNQDTTANGGNKVYIFTVTAAGMLTIDTSIDVSTLVTGNLGGTTNPQAITAVRLSETDILVAVRSTVGATLPAYNLVLLRKNDLGVWGFVSYTEVYRAASSSYTMYVSSQITKLDTPGYVAGGICVMTGSATYTVIPYTATVSGDVITAYAYTAASGTSFNNSTAPSNFSIAPAGNNMAVAKCQTAIFAIQHTGAGITIQIDSVTIPSATYIVALGPIAPGYVLMCYNTQNNTSPPNIQTIKVSSGSYAIVSTFAQFSALDFTSYALIGVPVRVSDDEFIFLAQTGVNTGSSSGFGGNLKAVRCSFNKADGTVAAVGSVNGTVYTLGTASTAATDYTNRRLLGGCVLPNGDLLLGVADSNMNFRYFVLRNQ